MPGDQVRSPSGLQRMAPRAERTSRPSTPASAATAWRERRPRGARGSPWRAAASPAAAASAAEGSVGVVTARRTRGQPARRAGRGQGRGAGEFPWRSERLAVGPPPSRRACTRAARGRYCRAHPRSRAMSLPVVPIHDPVAHPDQRQRSLPRRGGRAGGRDPRAGAGAGRRHPGAQLPAPRGPAARRPRGRLAPARHHRARGEAVHHRLLRGPLHGRVGQGAGPRQAGPPPQPLGRLLPGRLDHRRVAGGLEGALPRPRGGHLRQLDRRGEGPLRRLLHLRQRRQRGPLAAAAEDPLHAGPQPGRLGQVRRCRRRRWWSTTAAARSTTCCAAPT